MPTSDFRLLLNSNPIVHILHIELFLPVLEGRIELQLPRPFVEDTSGLSHKGRLRMLTNHCDEDVEHNVGLGQVRRRALNEDVLGIDREFGMVSVDDGREGDDDALRVSDHWM